MPKVTLQFTLPEEEPELKLAQRGPEFFSALFDIMGIVRKRNKYDAKMEDCWNEIEEILNEINIDDIP